MNASRSVSPINFLPGGGFLQADPKPTPTGTVPPLAPVQQLAQVK